MSRVPFSSIPVLLLAGVLLPNSLPQIGVAHASSGGVPPFKGTVVKCVGFNLLFNGEQAGVYVHNDGAIAAAVRVRFLDASGATHSNASSTILPGQTAGFGDVGTDEFHRVMVAKVTSSSPAVIVDAERVTDGVERRQVTCAASEDAPDFISG
jgi:hypothetical protein